MEEDELEAMKFFKDEDRYSFLSEKKLQPNIIAALKKLEQDNTIACAWEKNQTYPMDCELTEKGFYLREHLKENVWNKE